MHIGQVNCHSRELFTDPGTLLVAAAKELYLTCDIIVLILFSALEVNQVGIETESHSTEYLVNSAIN